MRLKTVFALVMGCFFVSGVAGLVYQIAWARYLSLFLGHSSYAVVAVLVAFMGGLAIGNALFGGIADRSKKPLALYAWLEIGIAIYAAIFPWYYEVCNDLYLAAARQLGGVGAPLLALKFAFSFLTILLPTTLMGATFPALTRFVTRSLAELRERVASLYFMNSIGAVIGCVIADFWWIPAYGLEFTVFGAAALNLAAGLVALLMSRSLREGETSPEVAKAVPPTNVEEYFSPLDLKIATIAIGCSGFVAMLYEVAWTRLLALALGSSTHAYSIMLITFISGISLGAALVARWKTHGRTLQAFGWAEMGLAATVLLSMFTYELLPYWFTRLSILLARRPDAYPLYELLQGFICFAVMFIPATCLGTTLPLASRIATAEFARTGRSVGKIFAVNTLGTVLGAAVTGFLLMPTFGLSGTFAIGFAMNAAIGALILYRNQLQRARPAAIGGALAVVYTVALVFAARHHFEPLWRGAFTQGIWRIRAATTIKSFRETGRLFRYHYYKDGPGSTVMLHYYTHQTNYMSLRVNGKTDASSGDVGTQLILGHLPALMHTSATNALVIGLGSGMTSGGLLRHTNIAHVDTVEISPQIAEAARYFKDFNDNVFENPRFRLHLDDAKSFLKITDQKYDIIVSEPSNPWMAGVAAVFSIEFYESCAARLAKGGVMVQWIQIYETSDQTLQTMIKTFATVFPFASIWRSQEGDIILVGTPERRPVNLDAFLGRMSDPSVHADLQRAAISEPLALLSREILSAENGAFITTPEIPIHSDYYPALEYMAQVGFFVAGGTTLYDTVNETRTTRPTTVLGAYLKKYPLTLDDYKRAAKANLDGQFVDKRLTHSLMEKWSELETNTSLPLEMIERLGVTPAPALLEEARLIPRHNALLEEARTDIATLHFYERILMRAYRAKRTIFHLPATKHLEEILQILLQRDPTNRRVFDLHLAELAWDRGDDRTAHRHAAAGLDPSPAKAGPFNFTLDEEAPRIVLHQLIETSLRAGNLQEAASYCAQAAGYKPQNNTNSYPPLDLACRKVTALGPHSK